MINYQEKFKKQLIFLFLIILILPLMVVFSFREEPNLNPKKVSKVLVNHTATLNLRGTIRDIKLSKDSKTAYVVAASRGIYVVDIKDPMKPKLISQFKYFKNSYDKARSIELLDDKNILFVRDAQAGIYSIDIANPFEPKLLATYKSQVPIHTFCISKNGNKLYISDTDGIKVANIKNQDEIKIITNYNKKRKYLDIVEVKDNLIYTLSSSGIDIIDFNFIKNPKLVANYVASGDSNKITLSKKQIYTFLSNGYGGVEILDTANKLNPKPLGIFQTSNAVRNTIVSYDAKTIYISNLNDSIEVINIQDINNAKSLQKMYINPTKKAKIWGMTLSPDENTLFIANGIGGMKIISLK